MDVITRRKADDDPVEALLTELPETTSRRREAH